MLCAGSGRQALEAAVAAWHLAPSLGRLDDSAAQAISQRLVVARGPSPASEAASTPSPTAEATVDAPAAGNTAAAAVADAASPTRAEGELPSPWSFMVQCLRQGGAVLQRISATAGALGSSLADRLHGRAALGLLGGVLPARRGGVVQRHLRDQDTFQLPNQTNRLSLAFSPLEGYPFLAGLEMFEAEHRTAPHVHPDAFELFFIVSGARLEEPRAGACFRRPDSDLSLSPLASID